MTSSRALFEEHTGLIGVASEPAGASASQRVQLATVPPHRLSGQLQLCLRYAYGQDALVDDIVREAPGPHRALTDVTSGMSTAAYQAWRGEVEKAWFAKLRTMPQWRRHGNATPETASTTTTTTSRATSVTSSGGTSVSASGAYQPHGGRKGRGAAAMQHHPHAHVQAQAYAQMASRAMISSARYGPPMQHPMGWATMAPPGAGFMQPQQMPAMPVMHMAPMIQFVPMVQMVPGGQLPYDMGAAGYGTGMYGMQYGWQ